MDQKQGEQRSGQGGSAPAPTRPAVLDQVSSTTLDDLEQQFAERDRPEWNRFTESFGWSQADSDAVWNWFDQGATASRTLPAEGGFPQGPGPGNK